MKEQVKLIIKTQLIVGGVDADKVDIITDNIINLIHPCILPSGLSYEALRAIDEWVMSDKKDNNEVD